MESCPLANVKTMSNIWLMPMHLISNAIIWIDAISFVYLILSSNRVCWKAWVCVCVDFGMHLSCVNWLMLGLSAFPYDCKQAKANDNNNKIDVFHSFNCILCQCSIIGLFALILSPPPPFLFLSLSPSVEPMKFGTCSMRPRLTVFWLCSTHSNSTKQLLLNTMLDIGFVFKSLTSTESTSASDV